MPPKRFSAACHHTHKNYCNITYTIHCVRCLQHEACFEMCCMFLCYATARVRSATYTLQCCSATSDGLLSCSGLLIWCHVLSVDTRCFLLCADNVLAGMLDLDVHAARPGCRGRVYVCLRLYAFDRDDMPCRPACTRRTPADSCASANRGSQPTMSSANVSVNCQRIYHLMTWTVCTSTVITRLVTVHL